MGEVTTLNDIADALETTVGTIASLTVYSEPDERPQGPKSGAAAEVVLLGRNLITQGGSQTSAWGIDVSCPSDDKAWSRSVRQVRSHLDATGADSIEAKLRATPGLGLAGVRSGNIRVEPERRVQYGDGMRWVGRVALDVLY